MILTKPHRRLARQAAGIHGVLIEQFVHRTDWALPDYWWQCCQSDLDRLRRAQLRGWHLMASRLQDELRSSVSGLVGELERLLTQMQRREYFPLPSARDVYLDMAALQEEFAGTLAWDRSEAKLSVETEPVELEGRYLGAFRIELHLEAIHTDSYSVVALDPQPAAKDDSITHPHVQDGRLCAGDGKTAIRAALDSGRLLDFFVLVSSVLNTYNPEGPYVSLDNWDGISCADCDGTVYEDSTSCCRCQSALCEDCGYPCEQCGDTYCSECYRRCDACNEPLCSGCAVTCRGCQAACCPSCIQEDKRCDTCHDNDKNTEKQDSQPQPAGAAV